MTMTSAVFSAIAYLCWAIAPDYMLKSMEMIKEMKMFTADQAEQILTLYSSITSWQYLLLTLVEMMLFTGAFLMLVKLNQAGFHVYTIDKFVLGYCPDGWVLNRWDLGRSNRDKAAPPNCIL